MQSYKVRMKDSIQLLATIKSLFVTLLYERTYRHYQKVSVIHLVFQVECYGLTTRRSLLINRLVQVPESYILTITILILIVTVILQLSESLRHRP